MIIDTLREMGLGAHSYGEKYPNTPVEFKGIKMKFQQAKEKGVKVLLESSELNLAQSVVLDISYVGERWCMGHVTYHRMDQDIRVPYTIPYADLYTSGDSQSKSKNIKIVFKGENPFG